VQSWINIVSDGKKIIKVDRSPAKRDSGSLRHQGRRCFQFECKAAQLLVRYKAALDYLGDDTVYNQWFRSVNPTGKLDVNDTAIAGQYAYPGTDSVPETEGRL